MTERTPPQNVNLEMAVLGGCMMEPQDAMPIVSAIITRDSFYLEGHAIMWGAMLELHRRGIPPDSIAVLDVLRKTAQLQAVGGAGVVNGMLNSVPTAANVEHHARIVHEKALYRQLIRACTRVIDDCYRQDSTLVTVLDRAESSILALSAHMGALGADARSLADILGEYVQQLTARADAVTAAKKRGETVNLAPGLRTHFLDLDAKLGGLRPTELIIIAGRPGEGKSALAANIAVNIARRDKVGVLLFSMEMADEELGERMLATNSHRAGKDGMVFASTSLLAAGEMPEAQWNAVSASYNELCDAPLYIWDRSAPTAGELISIARQTHSRHRLGLIIIDYLQLLTSERDYANLAAETTLISRACKRLARDLRLPVIALSQLSRESVKHNRRPVLSDLRESGAIEQDANKVLFLYHEPGQAESNIRDVEIIIAKNRRGPTGTVMMQWQPSITKFMDKAR